MTWRVFSIILQYTVTQSELDLYKSNQAKETAKLTETQRNIERAANTLKERRRLDDYVLKLTFIHIHLNNSI